VAERRAARLGQAGMYASSEAARSCASPIRRAAISWPMRTPCTSRPTSTSAAWWCRPCRVRLLAVAAVAALLTVLIAAHLRTVAAITGQAAARARLAALATVATLAERVARRPCLAGQRAVAAFAVQIAALPTLADEVAVAFGAAERLRTAAAAAAGRTSTVTTGRRTTRVHRSRCRLDHACSRRERSEVEELDRHASSGPRNVARRRHHDDPISRSTRRRRPSSSSADARLRLRTWQHGVEHDDERAVLRYGSRSRDPGARDGADRDGAIARRTPSGARTLPTSSIAVSSTSLRRLHVWSSAPDAPFDLVLPNLEHLGFTFRTSSSHPKLHTLWVNGRLADDWFEELSLQRSETPVSSGGEPSPPPPRPPRRRCARCLRR